VLEPLLDDIRALVDAPVTGERRRFLDDLERTLTDGYAHALALESERMRLERRRGALLGDGRIDEQTTELGALTTRIAEADERLEELRELLDTLRRRASSLRAA
jgi:recombinational DNA repair ATPase RecF